MLSKDERQEIMHLVQSQKFNQDMRKVKRNHNDSKINRLIDIDNYIKFLNVANAFTNHRIKSLKKIQGENFKI